MDIKSVPSKELVREFKRLNKFPPSVMTASNEEMDKYYDRLIDVEQELNRRLDAAE